MAKSSTSYKKADKRANNGRPKGALNKVTRDIKEIQAKLLSCISDKDIQEMVQSLKLDKPEALLRYFGTIAPKNLRVETEKPSIVGVIEVVKDVK